MVNIKALFLGTYPLIPARLTSVVVAASNNAAVYVPATNI
jgi:hypothetical protein